jgi:anti-sigma regulatory factor (Ser/Thr protein kinase)
VAELLFIFQPGDRRQEQFRFAAEMETFAAGQAWPPLLENEVNLILEECLTNIFNYALSAQPHPQVQVRLQADRETLRVEVTDNGLAFDPTQHPAPDINLPLEERPIGGLGIHMMRKLSRSMHYKREGEWNILTIEKSLQAPSLGTRR